MRLFSAIYILLFFCLVSEFVSAQEYFRISANFTTKVKPAVGKVSLTKGRVYYDKYNKDLIYNISFPQKEKWVVKQSRILKIINDSVYSNEEVPSINEFTIFHLALNSNLSNYGLNEANFTINNIDRKNDMVISYWNVPQNAQDLVSSIAIAKKSQKLYSVVIIGQQNKILSKQFFSDYILIEGLEFPGKITQIFYNEDDSENYQVFEFDNIVLNDMENEKQYHYTEGK